MAKAVQFIDGDLRLVTIQDTDVVSSYSPQNFSPAQTGTEGDDKVSAYLKGIDIQFGTLLSFGITDELFTSTGVSSDYTLATAFSNETFIDVFRNGILNRENEDWTRNASTNTITSINDGGSPLNWEAGGDIKIRVFDEGFSFTRQFFQGDGGSTYTLSINFELNAELDLYRNGLLLRPSTGATDYDYSQDYQNNQITFLDNQGNPLNVSSSNRMEVRLITVSKVDEWFPGGADLYNVTEIFDDADKIDVYVDGFHKIENEDWTRDSNNNQITVVDGSNITDSNSNILIRIWK